MAFEDWRDGAKAVTTGSKATKMAQFKLAWYAYNHYDTGWNFRAFVDDEHHLTYADIAPYFGVEAGTIKNWIMTVNAMSDELESLCDGNLLTASHVQALCAFEMPDDSRITLAHEVILRNERHQHEPTQHERCTTSAVQKMAKQESERWKAADQNVKPVDSIKTGKTEMLGPFTPNMTQAEIVDAVVAKVITSMQGIGQEHAGREVLALTFYLKPEISLGGEYPQQHSEMLEEEEDSEESVH